MLDDMLVADATAHGFNWTDSNMHIPQARSIRTSSYALHRTISEVRPELLLTEEEFGRDWLMDDVADTLFFESGIDLISHHGTPIFDFWKDGHTATHKGLEMKAKYPSRVIVYAAICPWFFDSEAEIRREVDLHADAGATGLKIYGARYVNGKTIGQRMDDEKYAYPMIEQALERGIKVIASHKAIPAGPVHYAPYGVDDFPLACASYPEMKFEIVHSGWAFVEETAFIAAAYENCWFNLEASFALITKQPRRFAEFLGQLLLSGAEDRTVYSSGFAIWHPKLALDAFLDFQMPNDLVEDYGMPQLTRAMKEKILGLNYLAMHDIDPAQFRQDTKDDEVSRRQANGPDEPWSNVRARIPSSSSQPVA